jgi:hypothetical protein
VEFEDARIAEAARAKGKGADLPPGYRYETIEDVIEAEREGGRVH